MVPDPTDRFPRLPVSLWLSCSKPLDWRPRCRLSAYLVAVRASINDHDRTAALGSGRRPDARARRTAEAKGVRRLGKEILSVTR
jgi:hypothetical protein